MRLRFSRVFRLLCLAILFLFLFSAFFSFGTMILSNPFTKIPPFLKQKSERKKMEGIAEIAPRSQGHLQG